jgi:hypothetical protein
MRITLLTSTEYQEEPLLQLLPQVPPLSIITGLRIKHTSQPESLWGGKRLHHMDIISFTGGAPAPSSGGAPMPPVKIDHGGDFAIVIDGNWTTMPAASRFALRACVILLLLLMFDLVMAPTFWSSVARRVLSAAAALAGRRFGGKGEAVRGIFRALNSTADEREAAEGDSEELQSLTHSDEDDISSSSSSIASAARDTSPPPSLRRLLLSLVLLVRCGIGDVGWLKRWW